METIGPKIKVIRKEVSIITSKFIHFLALIKNGHDLFAVKKLAKIK